jgi:hypothetical protein
MFSALAAWRPPARLWQVAEREGRERVLYPPEIFGIQHRLPRKAKRQRGWQRQPAQESQAARVEAAAYIPPMNLGMLAGAIVDIGELLNSLGQPITDDRTNPSNSGLLQSVIGLVREDEIWGGENDYARSQQKEADHDSHPDNMTRCGLHVAIEVPAL